MPPQPSGGQNAAYVPYPSVGGILPSGYPSAQLNPPHSNNGGLNPGQQQHAEAAAAAAQQLHQQQQHQQQSQQHHSQHHHPNNVPTTFLGRHTNSHLDLLNASSSSLNMLGGGGGNTSIPNNLSSLDMSSHGPLGPSASHGGPSHFASLGPPPMTWRLKERMKTVAVALAMCLNIGTEPPDMPPRVRGSQSSNKLCWFDVTATSRAKARDAVGAILEGQYTKWQGRAKYKKALDPTVEEMRALCVTMRRCAKQDRLLLHYNGMGVPRPTNNGEIWVFNKNYTQYIPLSIYEIRTWMSTPSIVVLDCSSAGILLPFFTAPMDFIGDGMNHGDPNLPPAIPLGIDTGGASSSQAYSDPIEAVRNIIVLCPCAAGELLPSIPDFPADMFTSCLTTPIPIALRWFIHQNPLSMQGVHLDVVDRIPGKINERKTPIGELNWIFTAITDTIAWNTLPSPLFQRLFRQDLLVASLFRNFLLADRILRACNCTPASIPALPPTSEHPLWQSWDLAVETCLNGLIRDGSLPNPGACNVGLTIASDMYSLNVQVPNTSPSNAGAAPIAGNAENAENNNGNADSRGMGGGGRGEDRAGNSGNSNNNGGGNTANSGQTQTAQQLMQQAQQLMQANEPQSVAAQEAALAREAAENSRPPPPFVTAPFFAEQLTAFEVWLEFGMHQEQDDDEPPRPPEQLPVVLQVLLSQAHRVRALILLKRFLDLGPWAVNLALGVGIFPYVLKLLQSPAPELRQVLVAIWSKILAFDPSCQVDLVKDEAHVHFISHLTWGLAHVADDAGLSSPSPLSDSGRVSPRLQSSVLGGGPGTSSQRIMAAFVLAAIMRDYRIGQSECLKHKLHHTCVELLCSAELGEDASKEARRLVDQRVPPRFRMWLCICIAELCKDFSSAQNQIYGSNFHLRLYSRVNQDSCSDVRASATYAIGMLLGGADDAGDWHYQRQQHPMPSDEHRIPLDIVSVRALVAACDDASPVVRYEATVALGVFVNKYLNMFATVASQMMNNGGSNTGERNSETADLTNKSSSASKGGGGAGHSISSAGSSSTTTRQSSQPRQQLGVGGFGGHFGFDTYLDGGIAEDFAYVWTTLIGIQHTDPQPNVASAADAIVKAVHERVSYLTVRYEQYLRDESSRAEAVGAHIGQQGEQDGRIDGDGVGNPNAGPPGGSGLGAQFIGAATTRSSTSGNHAVTGGKVVAESNTSSCDIPGMPSPGGLRRDVSSGWLPPSAVELFHDIPGMFQQYHVPRSGFYEWKKNSFGHGESGSLDGEGEVVGDIDACIPGWCEFGTEEQINNSATSAGGVADPLSQVGALKAYRRRRNEKANLFSKALADKYAHMAPGRNGGGESGGGGRPGVAASSVGGGSSSAKPGMSTREEVDVTNPLGFGDDGERNAKNEDKSSLKMDNSAVLDNDSDMTSLLIFHPFENALVVCDDFDGVSIWNVEAGKKMTTFSNANAVNSRMTSTHWINEAGNSLLLTGCDDGTVRLWDGVIGNSDEVNPVGVALATSFFGAPDMTAGQRGSGLITEWQQSSGGLICGGNSGLLRFWDLEMEKCTTTLETASDACVTCLCTAWSGGNVGGKDSIYDEGFSGLGSSVIVAGFGDGSLKCFDVRARGGSGARSAAALSVGGGIAGSMSHTTKSATAYLPSRYQEHTSWIVGTKFTNFGGHNEVVSACVAGDTKFWDLRFPNSLRTVDVQRSPMTAFAAHSHVPIMATGSHTQFIKILDLDGNTLNVIRYHEGFLGQRIGPVSCLAFHPRKLILAAGATDAIISLYGAS